MNRSVFRNVAILIVGALVALTALQAVWLKKMYSDMRADFDRRVHAAMDRAAYEELIQRRGGASRVNTSFYRANDIDSIRIMDFTAPSLEQFESVSAPDPVKNIVRETLETGIRGRITTISGDTLLIPDMIDTSRTVINLRGSGSMPDQRIVVMNMKGSVTIPTYENAHRFDSLLSVNLVQAGIGQPYLLRLLNDADKAEIYGFGEQVANPMDYDLTADGQGRTLYRLSMENPRKGFIKDMAGLLFSSALIVVLLFVSFAYLLRTMFRQKSLEQMRMDFTHNITHELKTPIAVASAAAEALDKYSAGDDPLKRKKYLGIVSGKLEELSGMVERILSMSVYEDGGLPLNYESVSINELLRGAAEQYVFTSGRQTGIRLDLPAEDIVLRCDPFHMGNMINNLLDNAVKYSGAKADIRLSANRDGRFVVVSVADRGIGIAASAMPHVFEKFYRVPTGDLHEVKGFGLGLYYVRSMAEKHGGGAYVSANPGGGSVFTIKIPCDE